MTISRDLPALDGEIAALPHAEFVDRITIAYRMGDRDGFLTLGQRLARGVVAGMVRSRRLLPHVGDMYSVGLLALVEQFDRGTKSHVSNPFGFFRRVAYLQILQHLYRQRILVKKGAKRPLLFVLDTDLSGDRSEASYIDNVADRVDATIQTLSETIELCLQTAAERNDAAKVRGERAPVAKRRKRRPVASKQRRSKRALQTAAERTHVAKRRKRRTPMTFDASVTANPRELRQQGMTWQAIGELLGISLTAAYNAAHSATQRSPQELRQQAADSRMYRAGARRLLAAV